jgi:DNA-directed RNA polymerase subunit F
LVKQAQGTYTSAKKSIKLTTLDRNGLEYITIFVVIAKGAANRVKPELVDASQGPKMPVVNDIFDVLPEELSVMPLDSDIEFVIEIVPILLLCIRDPIG